MPRLRSWNVSQVTDFVLHSFMDVNHRDVRGCTPIIHAARNGSESMVKTLIEMGADLMTVNDDGFNAVHACSMSGNPVSMQLLLDAGADVQIPTVAEGMTGLHIVAQEGHVKTAKILLKKDTNVDVVTKAGATALYTACSNGHDEVVEVLLQHGANPLISCDKFSPLEVAAFYNYSRVIGVLIDHIGLKGCGGPTFGQNALRYASQEQSVESLGILWERGARDEGAVALKAAVMYGKEKSLLFLLRNHDPSSLDSYVNTRDDSGRAALFWLFTEHSINPFSYRMFRWLMDSGANFFHALGYGPPSNANKLTLTSLLNSERDTYIEALRLEMVKVHASQTVSWGWPSSCGIRVSEPRRVVRWKRTSSGPSVVVGMLRYSGKEDKEG